MLRQYYVYVIKVNKKVINTLRQVTFREKGKILKGVLSDTKILKLSVNQHVMLSIDRLKSPKREFEYTGRRFMKPAGLS